MKPGRISKNAPGGSTQTHGAPASTQYRQNKTEVQTLQTRTFLGACQSGSSLSPTTSNPGWARLILVTSIVSPNRVSALTAKA